MTETTPMPVFDGHNDTILDLYEPPAGDGPRTFFERSQYGHIDLPRARDGGVAGGFFAIFIPTAKSDRPPVVGSPSPRMARPLKLDYAQQTAMAMMALLYKIEAESAGDFRIVRSVADIEAAMQAGALAAIMHFEGAEAIDEDLHALEVFYRAGLRSLGPVWSRKTIFGDGVPFRFPHSPDIGPGLTDAGKRLVKRCNELGIMLDLSHLNEKGFWDVASLSDAPLVATHSNVHALCPSPRNLTDAQLDAIRESDGMVGLNFATGFLREDGEWTHELPLTTMVRHIDYLIEKLGEDRVGFGSDFDGARVSEEIKDVTGLPRLVDALRQAGYSEALLRKITHENWLRLLRKTWRE